MEINEVYILKDDIAREVGTCKHIDIDTTYDYIKGQGFKLVDIKERKIIEFFRSKDEWICWCCERIRIKIGDDVECVPGIRITEGTFYPNKERCQYLIDGACQYQFICPNVRYGRTTKGILDENK